LAGKWANGVRAITLFVDDIDEARRFYERVFEMPLVAEDEVSAAFDFGNMIVNLLQAEEAPPLIEPAEVGPAGTGARMQFTITVDDVDAICSDLATRGVEFLNGPIDRPWGIRTAAFSDPAGHIWEIAKW
jgi:catechol 2,3-dioxygenase-like lactoylglutathione lyase family enzyme